MPAKKTSRIDWRDCAVRLAREIPLARLEPAAVGAARQRAKGRWTVAFSGGADSLALLLLVWAHFPEERRRLLALHFNHRLRGAESDADAAFCETVCQALGVRLRVGKWGAASKNETVSEASARAARQAFFAAEMKRAKSQILWLAHHLDDVAETLLMRLSRGSGTAGLAAPRSVQRMADGRRFVRPLLALKKSDLIAALTSAGATWREDATNATDAYFRNRVRHRVLPALVEAAGRDALAGIALSRARLEEDDAALDEVLDGLRPVRGRVLDWAAVAGAPRALRRRALHRWLLKVRPRTDLSRQGFDQLLAALERGSDTRFSLGAESFAESKQGTVRLVRR